MSFTDILARKLARDVKELQNTGVDLTARELINSLASKTVVTLNHQFADATARDAYFTANPTELVDKLFIKVGIGYQQYLESVWQDVSAVVTEQLTADQQALADIGNHFTDKTTEGALQEVGSELSNLATEVETKADKLKVATIEKELNDYQKTLAQVNVNQEVKQSVNGYGIVSLPKNSANGQVSVSVKGQTVANLIKNGDFSSGTARWTSTYSSFTVTDGIAKVYSSGSYRHLTQPMSIISGRKYYGKLRFMPYAENTSEILNIHVLQDTKGWDTRQNITRSANITANTWNTSSGLLTATTNATYIGLGSYPAADTTNYYDIDYVFVVDLTKIFGAGNEPTEEECDEIFTDYFDGTKSTISASRLKSVGKNLFDKSNVVIGRSLIGTGLSAVPSSNAETYSHSNYIKLKTGVNYKISGRTQTTIDIYDSNKNFVRSYTNSHDIILSGVEMYTRFNLATSNIQTLQLEQNTIVTPYEPHQNNEVYFSAKDENGNIGELRSLPNGTKDEVSLSDGKALFRTKKVKVEGSKLASLYTALTNVDLLLTTAFTDHKSPWSNVSLNTSITIDNMIQIIESERNNVESIGKYYVNNKIIIFIVQKGLHDLTWYQNPANFSQTLTYQLATPIEIPIETSGTLLSYPSGTIYVENAVADAGIYSDKFTILNTDLPIKEIEKISKVDFNTGVETQLDVTKAVINADKKSFTHPSLTANDIVFTTYFYDVESTQGELTVEYYDSRYTLKDSVTGKYYKVVQTVADGVLTQTLVEV